MKGYPGWFPSLVIATMVLVIVTGWLLVPSAMDFRMGYDVIWRLDSAHRIQVTFAHLLSSIMLAIIVGRLWQLHIPVGLKQFRNAYSGLSMVASFVLLVVTGVGVLYVGNQELSIASSVGHILAGLLITVVFVVHYVRGRRLRIRDQQLRRKVRKPGYSA